jgi:hypothetical protein
VRIGLTGTSGTGKTTLAKSIAGKYDLQLVTGVARNSPGAKNMLLNESATALNQLSILSTLTAWSEIDNTVSDRTPLDALAWTPACLSHLQITYVYDSVYHGLKNYDLIIFCPLYNWDKEIDDFRSEDEDFLLEREKFIKDYILTNKSYYNEIITMEDEPVEQRLKKIHQFMI